MISDGELFHISLKTVDHQLPWILLAGFESQEDSYRWIFKACRRHGVDFRTKSVGAAQCGKSDGKWWDDFGRLEPAAMYKEF